MSDPLHRNDTAAEDQQPRAWQPDQPATVMRDELSHLPGAFDGPFAPPGRWPWPHVGGTLAVCWLLSLGIWIVYGQTSHFGFVEFEDGARVFKNPRAMHGLSLAGIVDAISVEDFRDATGAEQEMRLPHLHEWLPLTAMSRMIDCQVFGLRPGGHHLVNVLLHGATVVLLFLLLIRVTARLWPSAFVAAVFALHPLHVASVAWITQRSDVLGGLFFMLALVCYQRFAQREFSLLHYFSVILCFGLGLLSSPMVITLPLVLLLFDYWPLKRAVRADAARLGSSPRTSVARRLRVPAFRRCTWGQLLREKWPLFGLSARILRDHAPRG